jgi:hypothetical protein
MWVYMFQRTEKRRQGKNLTIMWSIQFDNKNMLEVMNFQNTLKVIWKKNHIVRHSIKTYKKIKRKLFLKTPNFSSSKDSFMSWSEWIHNECIPWASSLCLYIYKHIYMYLYKIFVFCLFDHFAYLIILLAKWVYRLVPLQNICPFFKHESFAQLIVVV